MVGLRRMVSDCMRCAYGAEVIRGHASALECVAESSESRTADEALEVLLFVGAHEISKTDSAQEARDVRAWFGYMRLYILRHLALPLRDHNHWSPLEAPEEYDFFGAGL